MERRLKKNGIAGLSLIGDVQKEDKSEQLLVLLLVLALYISIINMFIAMLEFDNIPWIAITVGATVAIAEHFTTGRRTALLANCALAIVLVTVAIIWHNTLLDGIKLILNQIFTVSEKYQKYIYDRFSVSTGLENYSICVTAAMVIICTITAVVCHFAVERKNGLLAITFLVIIIAQTYYGIFPQLWTVILFSLVGLSILYHRHSGKVFVNSAFLLAFALIVSLILITVYTGPNSNQTALTENIRDRFDEHVEQQVNIAIEQRQKQIQEKTENVVFRENKVSDVSKDLSKGKSFLTEYKKHFEGSKAGLAQKGLPWALIFLGFMLLLLLTWYLYRMYRAKKRLRVFDSNDYAAAIDGMFRHSVDWLKVCGLKIDNSLYSQYSKQISKMLSDEYGSKYTGAVELWEEAIYSSHVMSEKERGRMRAFLDDTARIVSEHVGVFTRCKIKYRYFL